MSFANTVRNFPYSNKANSRTEKVHNPLSYCTTHLQTHIEDVEGGYNPKALIGSTINELWFATADTTS